MANFSVTVFVLFVFFERSFSLPKISWSCTTEFCDDYVQRFPCPPLDPACSNPNISMVLPSLTVCNCCEHCFIFQDLGEDCVIGHPGQPLPTVICKPGTLCREGKCVKMTTPDPDFHDDYECENGKCYCTVLENGRVKRIFGTFDETEEITKEIQCGCSISAYSASKTINKMFRTVNAFLPTPRCLPSGQFDPLQCIDNMCGCINKTTGTWDTSVHKVAITALGPNNPKCFNQGRHKTGQYYTNCEKERNNLMADVSWEGLGEIDVLLSHTVHCSPDGEYANPYS